MAKIVALGAVTTSAGTALPLIPTAAQAAYLNGFSKLFIKSLPASAGPVYLTTDTNAPNTTTYANIAFVLPISAATQELSVLGGSNGIYGTELYVNPSTTGYGVLVTGQIG